jgi:hypothetical protein
MKGQDRNYRLLEYLNVNTRTSYLARIRNPNPKMPDAENIGVASLGGEISVNEMTILDFVARACGTSATARNWQLAPQY